MKRMTLTIVLILFLAAPAFGKVKESEMMRGAQLSEPHSGLPKVVVGANIAVGSVAQPGWPIIVSAAMDSEADQAPEVPANLQVRLMDQDAHNVPVDFAPIERKDKSQRYWIASNQNLAPGSYIITFAPREGLAVEPGELEVQSHVERAELQNLLKIQQFLLTGKYDEAMAQADQMIAKHPNDSDAWIAKGDMLMAQDLPDQASDAYEKAGKPTIFLQDRMSRAFHRSLEKRGVISNPQTP